MSRTRSTQRKDHISSKTEYDKRISADLMPASALYGHFFRSESFVQNMQEQWMEAFQIMPGQWIVKTMLCDLDLNETQAEATRATTDIIPHDHIVELHEALMLIYQFEIGHKSANDSALLINASSLQEKHYIAFGKNEAIAFDKSGRPLITLNGHIVEYSHIEFEEIQKLQESWLRKQNDLLIDVNGMLPNFPFKLENLTFQSMLEVNDLLVFFASIKDYFEHAIKSYDQISVSSTSSADIQKLTSALGQAKGKIIKQFEKDASLEDQNLSDVEINLRGKLLQYVTLIDLYGHLKAAKLSFYAQMDGHRDSGAIQTNLIESAGKVRERYRQLGHPPATLEEIQADIIRLNPHTTHPLEERPMAFRTMMKTLTDITEELKAERNRLRKKSIERKHIQNNNKPETSAKIPIGSQIVDMMNRPRPPRR